MRLSPVAAAIGLCVVTVVLRLASPGFLTGARTQFWSTVFIAVCVQALPFLVLGVVASGIINAWVRPAAVARLLPRSPFAAVPLAAAAGAVLPGCECSSVPIAARMIDRGVPSPAALTFLLAAPAINPVVLIATAVAFPGRPSIVVARALAAFIAASVVGIICARTSLGTKLVRHVPPDADDRPRRTVALDTALHDFFHAGGFLVIGAASAATLQTVFPRSALDGIAANGVLAVVALGALAVVLSVCSEADAFIATGLTQFSLTARLAFLTVGPMVDLKLIALQTGSFGREFALRFAPLTFAVAILTASVVGWVLL